MRQKDSLKSVFVIEYVTRLFEEACSFLTVDKLYSLKHNILDTTLHLCPESTLKGNLSVMSFPKTSLKNTDLFLLTVSHIYFQFAKMRQNRIMTQINL